MERIRFDFSDKVVLVTGASVGIGAATARMFALHGADTAIAARTSEKITARAAELRADFGRRCLAVTADVTVPGHVEKMVEDTLAEFGRIDILINNAGNSVQSTLRNLTPELWQWGRALNMDSAAYCTMAVGKHFIERGQGVIVNISSVAGICGTMGEVPYSAGKAGVQMLTKVAAAEWGKYGIRVNCVSPGMTATEKVGAKIEAGIYSQEMIKTNFPLGRAGTSQEVCNAILFMASDYASYITGQNLAVDGGPSMKGLSE